jgi:hypothetical protein
MTCVVINNALILILMYSMLNLGDTEVRSTYNTMDRWKRTNNDLQNIAQKTTKDRATQTPLKSGCDFMFSGMVGSSASPLHIVYGLFLWPVLL